MHAGPYFFLFEVGQFHGESASGTGKFKVQSSLDVNTPIRHCDELFLASTVAYHKSVIEEPNTYSSI